jgi:hypothetical protein
MLLADAVSITPETNLAIPLTIVCVVVLFIAGVAWRAANFVRDIRDDGRELKAEIKAEIKAMRKELADTWNLSNMKDWTSSLERKNRNIPLTVHDPAAIRSGDSLHGSAPPL